MAYRLDIRINDDTVEVDVRQAVEDALSDEYIVFPDDAAQEEFIRELTDRIIDKYLDYFDYTPDYEQEVLDLAEDYEYIN